MNIKKLIYTTLGSIIAAFASCYGIAEALAFFKIIDQEKMGSKYIFIGFLEISIAVGIINSIRWMIVEGSKKSNSDSKSDVRVGSDESLYEMITKAYNDKRYSEVIQLGNAVSDYLWYCGRKELRIKIAEIVLVSAENINDEYTQSKVLIEDLGNTSIDGNDIKKIKHAIKRIENGVKIAKSKDYYYLIARGYRNLACAYLLLCKISDEADDKYLKLAEDYLSKGISVLEEINDNTNRIDAKASLMYARFRAFEQRKNREAALKQLEQAKSDYERLMSNPEKKTLAVDRLKKIYREIGKIYVSSSVDDDKTKGIRYLKQAIETSEADHDYSNMLRAVCYFFKYCSDDVYAGAIKVKCDRILAQVPDLDENKKKYKELCAKK